MKGDKLIEIFKLGNIVVPIYLFKNYKKFSLELDQFIFLIYLYNLGNHIVFDPSKFSNDLGFSLSEVMSYIGILSDNNLIKVDVINNDKGVMEEVIVMDNFYNKLSNITAQEVNSVSKVDNSNIFELIEKEFGRTISPFEYEIIKAWLESNITEELIKEALKEASFSGVSNLRYIDKILYEWGKLGIKNSEDLIKNKNKHKKKNTDEIDSDIDMDIVDWKWYDDEE